MLAEKVLDLGLDRLGEKGSCPVAQDFCELIGDVSWLNQLDDVIFGHGISLLRWRSGGVKHPQDMPPSRFPPSPTFGDSSSRHVTCPRLPDTSRPLVQRAQGRPGARCTRGLACMDAHSKRTRAYRFSGNTPAFPAQGNVWVEKRQSNQRQDQRVSTVVSRSAA